MNKRYVLAIFSVLFIYAKSSHANICGTDYQTFNPTTNGIDYISVQASETLEPCFINTGLSLNYAANSLTYSKTIGTSRGGTKVGDRLFSGDLGVGTGIAENWDAGINLPFLINQDLDRTQGVSYFKSSGVNEIRFNTKYKFFDDGDMGGMAAVFTVNQNLIRNNPFAGDDPGPTTNYEFVFDRKYDPFTVAFNFGYRHRLPGDPIANVPFTPMQDQWIFSAASSYYASHLDTKFVLELFGARPAEPTSQDTDRSLTATEWLIGAKKDLDKNLAFNAGFGSKILNSLGSPDWRLFAGVNWVMGPLCDEEVKVYETPSNLTHRKQVDIMIVPIEILFEFDSDIIKKQFYPSIERFLTNVQRRGFRQITISGHTDSIGDALYNLDLSERRAAAVARHVIAKYGLTTAKIKHTGFGENRPIASNANYQGRQKNRRVEFFVER